jgi:hypothetical protein
MRTTPMIMIRKYDLKPGVGFTMKECHDIPNHNLCRMPSKSSLGNLASEVSQVLLTISAVMIDRFLLRGRIAKMKWSI